MAWPQLYTRCFPSAPTNLIMGKPGVRDPALATHIGGAVWEISCGSGGAIIQNAAVPGSVAHNGCAETVRVRRNFGTQRVTVPAGRTLNVLCAAMGAPWTYFSSLSSDPLTAEAVDVVVVGEGMGGMAAARAAADAGATVRVVSTAGSTTALSSGVVWFPTGHTVAQLQEAAGAATADAEHLRAYVAAAAESFAYWDARLGLTPYPTTVAASSVYDYTTYSAGPRQGYSHIRAACLPSGVAGCGAATLVALRGAAPPPTEATVAALEDAGDGRLAVVDTAGRVAVVGRTVVLAVGGSARRTAEYDNIVAVAANTGVHLDVAAARGLRLGRADGHWRLEFQRAGNAIPTPRWFSVRCEPNVSAYDACADYHRRAASLPAGWHPLASATLSCPANTSGAWWLAFMAAYGGETCTDTAVAGGVIDSKAGFTIDTSFRSTEDPHIFAAGTTAAAVLGDTYFAPGATLGWALHSGRIAGQAAAATPPPPPRAVDRERPAALYLFATGVALLLGGVVLHFFDATRKAHYVLMPLAVAVLAAGVATARRGARPARDASSTHYTLGWVTIVWIGLQAAVGVGLYATNRGWLPASRFSSPAAVIVHRTSGAALLAASAVLAVTSTKMLPFYAVGDREEMRLLADAYAAAAGLACTKVLINAASRYDAPPLPKKLYPWAAK